MTTMPSEMTLRDYFAGQALTAAPWDYASADVATIARQAYALADAMLAAAKDEPKPEPVKGRRGLA